MLEAGQDLPLPAEPLQHVLGGWRPRTSFRATVLRKTSSSRTAR